MKSLIVSGIAALALGITTAQAVEMDANVVTPVVGTPATPTPTPYPQVIVPVTPKGADGAASLLPPIKLPGPPKDEALPVGEGVRKPVD